MPRVWLWPNLLSLDAPLVAVLWQVLFSRCFHAEVDPLAAVLLMLAVWLVYAADRMLDARNRASHLPRHEFHRRHWRTVLPAWIALFGLAAWLACTRLPSALFQRGMLLLGAVALYFIAVHLTPSALQKTGTKEAAVAILFALGASLAAWNHLRSTADVITILLFSCLCWINCVAITQWERNQSASRLIGACAVCVALAALILLHHSRPVLSAAETASALAFVLLDSERRRFNADALRVLADVALLSPVFFLPIAGTVA